MKTLLGTKFAVRKILLLMISGIFLVGCAYQTSAVPIDFGIESRTDLNGDGKEDRVRVIDRRDVGLTTIIANVNGIDVAIKDYRRLCNNISFHIPLCQVYAKRIIPTAVKRNPAKFIGVKS